MNTRVLIGVFLAAALAQFLYGFLPIYLPLPFGLGSALMVGIFGAILFFILDILLLKTQKF